MKKVVLTFGLIAGIIMSVLMDGSLLLGDKMVRAASRPGEVRGSVRVSGANPTRSGHLRPFQTRQCILPTGTEGDDDLQVDDLDGVLDPDGGRICADLYGQGPRAVVLAHGGRFNKESWREQAQSLAAKEFRVVAINFRGFGCSIGPGQSNFDTAPFANDVLAAVRYLKANGAKTVSVVGGSFGGAAAGDASIESAPGEIDRIVFLGAAPNLAAEKLKSRALFIVAREDTSGAGPRLPGIRAQYDRAPQPKELIVLDGSAHAQFLFQTDQSSRVMDEIVRFLSRE